MGARHEATPPTTEPGVDGGSRTGAVRPMSPARLATWLVEDPRAVTFLRGLSVGALVGAALAGSTLWSRLRHRRG